MDKNVVWQIKAIALSAHIQYGEMALQNGSRHRKNNSHLENSHENKRIVIVINIDYTRSNLVISAKHFQAIIVIDNEFEVLFLKASQGDKVALDQVFGITYPILKKIARGYLHSEGKNQTLQATALVNEAYLKLAATYKLKWEDRKHFLTIAARSMRQVLVDYARVRNAEKRGAEIEKIQLSTLDQGANHDSDQQLLDLDHALNALEKIQPRQAMAAVVFI
ncbi:MAG: ECF-type sigma factor, partial [Sideroxyarcus sp.]|nr:ECF-type sigma factor [Sideroxyarcus sp.]